MSGNKYIILKDENGKHTIPFTQVVVDKCGVDLCVTANPGETLDVILSRICSKIGNGGGNSNFTLNVEDTLTVNTVFNSSTKTLKSNVLVGPLDTSVTTLLNWDGNEIKRIDINDVGDILTDNSTFITNILNELSPLFVDSDSIDFDYNNTFHQLSANVKISSSSDNAVVVLSDGLYVPPSTFNSEQVQDAVFSSLQGINGITSAYDDLNDDFQIKWGGRLIENTTIFSNLNDFFNVTFTNLGQFNLDSRLVILSSTETPQNLIQLDKNFSTVAHEDGHITIGNNDIELHAFSGLVRINSSLYLDSLSEDVSSTKVLVQDITGVVSYRNSSDIVLSGGGIISIGLTLPSAFTVSTPVITNPGGTFGVTATGTTSQYIDGTGSLRAFPSIPTQYTDEMAQDAFSSLVTDTSSIMWSYNDAGNQISASITDSYVKGLFSAGTGLTYDTTSGQFGLNPLYGGYIFNGPASAQNPGRIWIYDDIRVGPRTGNSEQVFLAPYIITNQSNSPIVELRFRDIDHFGDAMNSSGSIKGGGVILRSRLGPGPSTPIWKIGLAESSAPSNPHFVISTNETNDESSLYTSRFVIYKNTGQVKVPHLSGSGTGYVTVDSSGNLNRGDIVSDVYTTSRAQEIWMDVDDEDAPAAGATTFTLNSCGGIPVTNKHIKFYRERARQKPGRDFSYEPSTGQVTVTVALETGETLLFEVYPQEMWTSCVTEPPLNPITNSLLINDTDALLINNSDTLLL
jgi:hypothetical protein